MSLWTTAIPLVKKMQHIKQRHKMGRVVEFTWDNGGWMCMVPLKHALDVRHHWLYFLCNVATPEWNAQRSGSFILWLGIFVHWGLFKMMLSSPEVAGWRCPRGKWREWWFTDCNSVVSAEAATITRLAVWDLRMVPLSQVVYFTNLGLTHV